MTQLGDNIKAENASWSFGKKVPKKFTQHISKSVPFYLEGHEIITFLSVGCVFFIWCPLRII